MVEEGEATVTELIESPQKITFVQQSIASCSGAIITSLLMTPLDVVKTRLQAQQKQGGIGKCYLYCNGLMDHLCECKPKYGLTGVQKRPLYFNGTLDAFAKISRTEGITSLWSGLSPTLVLALPTTVLYFVSYEQFRDRLKKYRSNFTTQEPEDKKLPIWIPLIAGASARVVSVSCVCPLELVRTKMQSEKMNYFQVTNALKALVKTSGVSGLWTGLVSTLLRDVPFSAIYWANYETMKNMYGTDPPTIGVSFMAGGISGTIAATMTVPFDVVKTHQQIEFGEKAIYTKEPNPNVNNIRSVIKQILREHGIRGMFAGLMPRLIKVAPACAIMISSFEYGKRFFCEVAGDDFKPEIMINEASLLSQQQQQHSIVTYKDHKTFPDIQKPNQDVL